MGSIRNRSKTAASCTAMVVGVVVLPCAGWSGGAASAASAASVASSKTSATVPVVQCPTTFAITPSPTSVPLPTSEPVDLSASQAAKLTVYIDQDGIMTLLGPKGWNCHALYGADGSGGLVLSPPGETVHTNPGEQWHLKPSSPIEAIVGYETGGSPVEAAALACALFRSAAQVAKQDLGRCDVKRPLREVVVTTGKQGVNFMDPAGVTGDGSPSGGKDPANGVMFYTTSQSGPGGYAATCTLPKSDRTTCTAVLNHFAAHHVRG